MSTGFLTGIVLAVCKKADPGILKNQTDAIQLVEDHGVEGDYHAGKTVRHRNLVKKDPSKPNYRQVLIVNTVIFEKIKTKDIYLTPGLMGENILINGIDLMSLKMGAQLEVGPALLELTDIREPCYQLNEIHPELLKAVVEKTDQEINLNADVFARVLKGGHVRSGDLVKINP